MASIDKVPGGWRARWWTPDGQSRSNTFVRKGDAERHLTTVEHAKLVGGYVDPGAGRVTFEGYAEHWRTVQVHRPGTASQVETNLRRHVFPRLGSRLSAIRRSEILTQVKALDDTLAPATVTLIYRWVVSTFRSALADRVIAETSCREIKLPNIDKAKVVPLAVDTVAALVGAVPDRYRALILLGAGTGVRISEALGLTSDRVDWMRRSVTVDRPLVRDGGEGPVFGPVKDRKNRPRTIPLPDTVMAGLVEHVRVYGLRPAGLVFTNTKGQPIRRTTFSAMWQAAARPLGIPAGDGFHTLRHFYASFADRSRRVGEGRSGPFGPLLGHDDPRHVRPSVARFRGLDQGGVDSVLAARIMPVTPMSGTS
jgi:integrase